MKISNRATLTLWHCSQMHLLWFRYCWSRFFAMSMFWPYLPSAISSLITFIIRSQLINVLIDVRIKTVEPIHISIKTATNKYFTVLVAVIWVLGFIFTFCISHYTFIQGHSVVMSQFTLGWEAKSFSLLFKSMYQAYLESGARFRPSRTSPNIKVSLPLLTVNDKLEAHTTKHLSPTSLFESDHLCKY